MTILLIFAVILVLIIILVSFSGKKKPNSLPIKYGDGDLDITLVNVTGVGRANAVKLLCTYMEISQKDGERIIQNLPYTFMKNVSQIYAEKLKDSFELIGAKIEIKKSKTKN